MTLLGAYSHYQTHRHMHFATIDRHARSSQDSWEGLAGLEGGLNFRCNKSTEIIPFARADYIYLSRRGFKEHGAKSLNLHVDRKEEQIIQSEVGVIWAGHFSYNQSCASGTIVPRLQVSYINDSSLNSRRLNANFVDSDCDFTVKGFDFCRRRFRDQVLGSRYQVNGWQGGQEPRSCGIFS